MQCLAGQSMSFTRVTRRAVHDYLEVIASVEYCVWTDDPDQPIFKVYCIGFDCSEFRLDINNQKTRLGIKSSASCTSLIAGYSSSYIYR